MQTNLANLPQDEMDKVNVDPPPPAWLSKSVTICLSSLKWSNANNLNICGAGFAND